LARDVPRDSKTEIIDAESGFVSSPISDSEKGRIKLKGTAAIHPHAPSGIIDPGTAILWGKEVILVIVIFNPFEYVS
jgi:hypothetical protein